MAEGLAGCIVIVMLIVFGVMLSVACSVTMLYKIKVGFIANQAAQFAASVVSWNTNVNPQLAGSPFATAQKKVGTAVDQMCFVAGLPTPATTTVTDNGATVVVTVQVNGLVQPFGLPVPVSLTETASADLTAYQPPAILELHPQTISNFKTAIPCYGYATSLNLRNKPPYSFTITLPGPASYF